MATRNGSAEWRGDLEGGTGELTVGTDSWSAGYTYKSRFEEGEGTNPEELLAAAHAACFSMALSNILAQDGSTPESVRTSARVQLRPVDGHPTVAAIKLETEAVVPGIEEAAFQDAVSKAKVGCPVSRALASVPEIDVEARLTG